MGDSYVTLDEAASRSGLHRHTIQRLVRDGVILGYKGNVRGRLRWMVSARALRHYCDPFNGFLLDRPGPKLYLRRLNDSSDDGK